MIDQTQASHPDAQALAAYALGRMGVAEMDGVESHLRDCESCCRAVEFPPGDSLLTLLRARGAGNAPAPVAGSGYADLPGLRLPSSFAAVPRPGEGVTEGGEEGGTTLADPGRSAVVPGAVGIPEGLVDHPRYRVESVLGTGGMGTVFLAEHRLMERPVALKVIRPDLIQTPALVDRFRREARAAAKLGHPNIVTAYDAEQVGGTHMLVMEFVEGADLAHHVRDHGPLPAAEACEYARQAALGLQHAHEHGMVHRDVKPQNLMRTALGQIKVLDFGLARFASELAARGGLTGDGVILGSADYIAPEQVDAPKAADIRSDVYSLGCTLYFLLAGRPPFPEGTLLQKLNAHARVEPTPLGTLRDDLPPGLAALVSRMMAKDPARRPRTPVEVALALAPFAAPTATTSTFLQGPKRPRRWGVAVAAAAVLLGAFAATVLRIRTPDGLLVVEVNEPGITVDVEDDGQAVKIHGSGLHELHLRPGKHKLVATRDQDGEKVFDDLVTIERDGRSVVRVRYTPDAGRKPPVPAVAVRTDALDRIDPAAIPAGERASWQPKELVAVFGHGRQRHWRDVTGVIFSADGKTAASAGDDRAIRVWDAETMDEKAVMVGHKDGINTIAFSRDGRRLLSCAAHGDPTIRLWDAENGKEIRVFEGHGLAVQSAAFSPDGTRVLSTSQDGSVRVWDTETGKPLRHFHIGSWVWVAIFSPDGRTAFAGSSQGKIRRWDLGSGEELPAFEGHKEGIGIRGLAISPDGRRLLSGSDDGSLRLWDVEKGEELHSISTPNDLHDLAFSADGRLAIGRAGKTVLVTDGETGAEIALLEHPAGVGSAAICADGTSVVTGDDEGTVRLWDAKDGKERNAFHGHVHGVRGVAISTDGRRLLSGGSDNTVRLWDADRGKELHPIEGPVEEALTSAISPDGTLALSAGGDEFPPESQPGHLITNSKRYPIRVWDPSNGRELRRLQCHVGPVNQVVFLPDGRRAISCANDHTMLLWDVATARVLRRFEGHNGDVSSVAVSADGKTVLSGSNDGVVHLWDVEGGRELRRLEGHTGWIGSVAMSPDGHFGLSGGEDKVLRLWDLRTGEPPRKLLGHDEGIRCVAISPDGRSAFSGGNDRAVNHWSELDKPEPRKVAFSGWHTDAVRSLAVSPDGKTLASSDDGGRIVLWEAATGRKLREFRFPGPVTGLTFAADGRHLSTANGNGTASILRLPALEAE